MCVYKQLFVTSSDGIWTTVQQAYDGHMNLIMSDVEEAILIVEGLDEPINGEATVRVSGSRCFLAQSQLKVGRSLK
jgi:small nuclear ribonucleoprotein (snRNP)-like protein